MKKYLKRSAALCLALLLVLAMAGCGEAKTESVFASAKEGDALGDFSAALLSGETFTLSERQDQVILVNFWATWCDPCVGELPDFQKLQEDYGDQLTVLAVNCNEAEKTVRSFVEDNGYTFAVATDNGALSGFLSGIPYTVLLDQAGNVVYTRTGSGEDMYTLYATMIDKLLQ